MKAFKVTYTDGTHYTTNANGTAAEFDHTTKQTATQPAEYPMIEGEGAPQYCFDLPAEPVQLALL